MIAELQTSLQDLEDSTSDYDPAVWSAIWLLAEYVDRAVRGKALPRGDQTPEHLARMRRHIRAGYRRGTYRPPTWAAIHGHAPGPSDFADADDFLRWQEERRHG